MALILILVIGVLAGAVIGARVAARRLTDHYARANEVVPGIPSTAPTAWLGAHDPEAKLHRRLVDAVRALHAGQDLDVIGAYLDLRIEVEQQAVAIDNELVVTSKLPVHLREKPLDRLTAAVATLEEAVAAIGVAVASGTTEDLDALLLEVRRRTDSLDRAEAALREIDEATPDPSASEEPGERPEPGSSPA